MNTVDNNIYEADLGDRSPMILIRKLFCKRAGFTLMELMLVVVLVGILVSVAVGSYSNFHKRAKTSEAKANLGNIRTYEESYYLAEENYLACPLHPATVPQGIAVLWGDTQVPDEWEELGFEPQGRIRYSYKVETSGDKQSFTATANGDLDGDGTYSTFSIGDSGGEIQESLPLE
jgi:prepilin-type N-terminal cleavage/methylation domain-containing protein